MTYPCLSNLDGTMAFQHLSRTDRPSPQALRHATASFKRFAQAGVQAASQQFSSNTRPGRPAADPVKPKGVSALDGRKAMVQDILLATFRSAFGVALFHRLPVTASQVQLPCRVAGVSFEGRQRLSGPCKQVSAGRAITWQPLLVCNVDKRSVLPACCRASCHDDKRA